MTSQHRGAAAPAACARGARTRLEQRDARSSLGNHGRVRMRLRVGQHAASGPAGADPPAAERRKGRTAGGGLGHEPWARQGRPPWGACARSRAQRCHTCCSLVPERRAARCGGVPATGGAVPGGLAAGARRAARGGIKMAATNARARRAQEGGGCGSERIGREQTLSSASFCAAAIDEVRDL